MLFYLLFISNARYLSFEQYSAGFQLDIPLLSVYTSLKYIYLCNLVLLLLAGAILPPKTVQIPAHAPVCLWWSQNGNSKHLWSAELDPFSTDDGSLQKKRNRKNKNDQKLQIGHAEAGKTTVHHLLYCGSGGWNSSWLCAWRCSFSVSVPACTTGPLCS